MFSSIKKKKTNLKVSVSFCVKKKKLFTHKDTLDYFVIMVHT